MKRVRWAGFKLPIQVPLPGRLILGMHQQRANSGNVCSLCGAQQRVLEQRLAKPCALVLKIDGKPGAKILHALSANLSWTHLRQIVYIDDPLKRDFYAEMCRSEQRNFLQLCSKPVCLHPQIHGSEPSSKKS